MRKEEVMILRALSIRCFNGAVGRLAVNHRFFHTNGTGDETRDEI